MCNDEDQLTAYIDKKIDESNAELIAHIYVSVEQYFNATIPCAVQRMFNFSNPHRDKHKVADYLEKSKNRILEIIKNSEV